MGIDEEFDRDMNGDIPPFDKDSNRFPSDAFNDGDDGGNLMDHYWIPHDTDRIVIGYHGKGRYVVLLQTSTFVIDRQYRIGFLGTLEKAYQYAFEVREALGSVDTIWVADTLEYFVEDEHYDIDEDLTPGERYWWVDCGAYGAYPGDEWYEERLKADEDG